MCPGPGSVFGLIPAGPSHLSQSHKALYRIENQRSASPEYVGTEMPESRSPGDKVGCDLINVALDPVHTTKADIFLAVSVPAVVRLHGGPAINVIAISRVIAPKLRPRHRRNYFGRPSHEYCHAT